MAAKDKVGIDSGLTVSEKKRLIELARLSIESRLKGKPLPHLDFPPSIQEKKGAFVSLHRRGRLRGCIGCLEPRMPLYDTVEQMACSAAFGDPRFPPLTPDELNDIEIEISVLTPFREIREADEIEVGLHGILIERGHCCGLLLPQVATQYGWDTRTFLQETCRKAGLPGDAWKDRGTRIYVFSADVFSAHDLSDIEINLDNSGPKL